MFSQLDPSISEQRNHTLDSSVAGMLLFVASWRSQHLFRQSKQIFFKKIPLEMDSDN